MLHRIRRELTVLAAVAISITALVFAISDDGTKTAVAVPGAAQAVSSAAIIPEGAREVDIVNFTLPRTVELIGCVMKQGEETIGGRKEYIQNAYEGKAKQRKVLVG